MNTRSKDFNPVFDFDESSRLWNANKKKLKNGCYEYVCGNELDNGLFCKRTIKKLGCCPAHKKPRSDLVV